MSGFSIEIARGEWIGVTGPNGGGKTSLLLGLAGLWPSGGELRLDGTRFGSDTGPGLRRDVAAILQDPSSQLLQPTVFDELAFAARNLGVADGEVRARVARWSGRFRLSEDLDRDPARLSAGRQQLVLVAAALAAGPRLLLADEATAHMDPGAAGAVLAALREEVARGLALFWVTQNPLEAKEFSRTIVLGAPTAGRLRAPAAPEANGHGERRVTISVSPMIATSAQRPIAGPSVSTRRPIEIVVPRAGIVGLTGPNGAGKSVILMAAAGVEPVAQVRIEWAAAPSPPPIAALQFPDLQIFQEHVSDEMIFASVARGLPRGEALARVGELLEQAGIEPGSLIGRRTWGLAAGEKRIMEVVAALAAPSCLYLLDEPTAGLDPLHRHAMMEIIHRMGSRNSIVLASQDRDWLAGLGCQVVEIEP